MGNLPYDLLFDERMKALVPMTTLYAYIDALLAASFSLDLL